MELVPEALLPNPTSEPFRRAVTAGLRLAKAAGAHLISQETAVLNARGGVAKGCQRELGKIGLYEVDNHQVGVPAEVKDKADALDRRLTAVADASIDYAPAAVFALVIQTREFVAETTGEELRLPHPRLND